MLLWFLLKSKHKCSGSGGEILVRIRIRIWILGSVYGSGSSDQYTDLDPRIGIRIWILGSVYGSGSSDPYLWLTNLDADPVRQWFSRRRQTILFFLLSFSSYSFLKVHLHHSSKINSHKAVTKQYKWRFFLIFLLVNGRTQIGIRTNKLRIRMRI
jgi:hypothetical protein